MLEVWINSGIAEIYDGVYNMPELVDLLDRSHLNLEMKMKVHLCISTLFQSKHPFFTMYHRPC